MDDILLFSLVAASVAEDCHQRCAVGRALRHYVGRRPSFKKVVDDHDRYLQERGDQSVYENGSSPIPPRASTCNVPVTRSEVIASPTDAGDGGY
jgi:hypothetical protein